MQKRKDHKGRVLKDGETYRKNDGLYMYRWIGGDKKRHAVYCSTLEGLREKEKEIQNDLRDGIQQGSSNITLNDVYKMWKNDKVGLKQTTRNNYIYMYEHFVMNDFGNRKIKEIRKSDVRRYYNGIVDSKKMSVATLESIHTVLHQVFILAVEDGYIRINPSDLVLGDVKRSHNFETPKRHALTIPQQEAFVSYINKSEKYKHWLPLFTFFLGTGCRVSEVVGLRWEDVHMDENYIEINHNMVYYQRDKGRCYFSVTSPKTTAGYRIIPMLPEVKQAILNEKKYQEEVGLTCQASIDGYTDFIFLNRNGFAHKLNELNDAIKSMGGEVVGINTETFDGNKTAIKEATPVLESQGVKYRNLSIDSSSAAGKYASEIMAFPTTILVDRNGNIVGEPMLGGIDNKDNYDALMKQIQSVIDADSTNK